jgi:hypothetical protein
MRCNEDPKDPGGVSSKGTEPMSNWSLAEEIARLAVNGRVVDRDPQYKFHRETCPAAGITPFEHPGAFRKRGKSSSNSQKWQCKQCGKITNTLPDQKESFTYHQQRNEVVPRIAEEFIGRSPVRRTCEKLSIGSSTYYNKLELMYQRCLEFTERHEAKAFGNQSFGTIWMSTDKMVYFLNNVRKRGQGGRQYRGLEDMQLPTHIVVSADISSRYVFRADVAYDWLVRPEDIEADTLRFKDDHLHTYARKNARLRFSSCPQPPTANDTQSLHEYYSELNDFNLRRKYIDGLHTNSTYTAAAHYWLIKQMVKADQWRVVSDQDNSLMAALYRVFAEEIRAGDAHHFTHTIDDQKTRKDAYAEYHEARKALWAWGEMKGIGTRSLYRIAIRKLADQLRSHRFFEYVNGHPRHAGRPLLHPLPTIDKGLFEIDCRTDVTSYAPDDLAEMLIHIDDKASSEFMQQIRRRISILERPLMTSRRTDGKTYIYANFNPRYAQYAVTILRTYYNFCQTWKRKRELTPAQRLGITDRKFEWKDIIYFQ